MGRVYNFSAGPAALPEEVYAESSDSFFYVGEIDIAVFLEVAQLLGTEEDVDDVVHGFGMKGFHVLGFHGAVEAEVGW